MFKTSLLTAAVAALAIAGAANSALLTITSATASHGGDRYANGVPSIYNGSGITKADPNDPSTWTFNGSAYGDELMSNFMTGATNSKVAWIAIDLGSAQNLGDLYLFNTNYQGGVSGVNSINIYYSSAPSVALPATPAKNTYASTGTTPQGDYDFASGGWTQFGVSTTAPKAGIGIYDMSGISAQFVAIEVLTNHGDTYNGGRTGIDEIAITQGVPEPGSLALLGLGSLLIGTRRRRG